MQRRSTGNSILTSPVEVMPPRTWVLNLEVEHELAHGPGFIPSALVLRRISAFVSSAQPLLGAGDRALVNNSIVESADNPSAISPPQGRCWSPTPAALKVLRKHGLPLPLAPSFQILQRVNHRQFCLPLAGGAPGACYVETAEQLTQLIPQLEQQRWLMKRPFGAAGREQRKLGGGPLVPEDRNWLSASLRRGGMLAEHWVKIEQEYSIHGLLSPSGALTLGQICGQEVSTHRSWQRTVAPAPVALSAAHEKQLHSHARQVALALHNAGYFGPFGIDAYTYQLDRGPLRFNSLSELNARYSMGFAEGFAAIENWRNLPGA